MKPILFSTEMVKAILNEIKRATRRVIKGVSSGCYNAEVEVNPYITYENGKGKQLSGTYAWFYCIDSHELEFGELLKSRYEVGDVLYVRETWCEDSFYTCILCEKIFHYKATEPNYVKEHKPFLKRWHPSIHMPKEAARIFLKVTNVRVERLRDITEEQAIEEGCTGVKCNCQSYACTDCMNTGWLEPPTLEFMFLWDSTIKKSDIDKHGWNANPWVFAYEFERCEKPNETEVTE